MELRGGAIKRYTGSGPVNLNRREAFIGWTLAVSVEKSSNEESILSSVKPAIFSLYGEERNQIEVYVCFKWTNINVMLCFLKHQYHLYSTYSGQVKAMK